MARQGVPVFSAMHRCRPTRHRLGNRLCDEQDGAGRRDQRSGPGRASERDREWLSHMLEANRSSSGAQSPRTISLRSDDTEVDCSDIASVDHPLLSLRVNDVLLSPGEPEAVTHLLTGVPGVSTITNRPSCSVRSPMKAVTQPRALKPERRSSRRRPACSPSRGITTRSWKRFWTPHR